MIRHSWLVLVAACTAAAPERPAPQLPAAWTATHPATVASADTEMVVSASPYATRAGLAVLRAGGNAVDAAVTVAFTLAVTYPTAGNLGGGGFLVSRMGDSSHALDFREVAPGRASRDMYVGADGKVTEQSVTGALAAGVPGSVAGLWAAHQRLGSRPWAELVQPAIDLARNGFAADAAYLEDLEWDEKRLARFASTRAVYLPGGKRPAPGDTMRNPDLAATLERIAASGRDGFYRGQTAALIAAEMRRSNGLITEADLAAYEPVWREPVTFSYRGHRIVSMPPASSGGLTLGLIFGILEGIDLGAMGWHSPQAIQMLAGAERHAFARRNTLLGDPKFVSIPEASFLSPDTAAALRAALVAGDRREQVPADPVPGKHTTHFSIVDARGNAVALTTTLNGGYGSALTVGGAGFLLNNEMDDFTTQVGVVNAMGLRQGEANAIAPGKRMLSSMTPTIVLDSTGATVIVTGASGGARIITAVAQVLSDALDFQLPLGTSMTAPRFHAQDFPDSLLVEDGGYSDAQLAALAAAGHHPSRTAPWGYDFGWAQTIRRRAGGRGWEGVSEPRGNGLAAGR
ncbi:MAG: gamma-glutamyltransferase [Gemmatimonadetes bacterium]|nr:gamma-glutamyltransferase [Gemmatimonadota bacterium]